MPTKHNPPPEDALWLEDIEEQLVSLVRTAEQRWQRIAALLIEVEAQELWRGAATSYTAWVQAVATKAGVHASGLWRKLKAGQFYNRMRDEQLAASPAAEVDLPELAKLESPVGPESFELLDKISRAAPPERTFELVKGTLAGETKREELRQAWLDYRPALSGSVRGRRRKGESLSQVVASRVEALEVLRAEMVQALRASRGGFLVEGGGGAHQWRVQTDVSIPAVTHPPIRFDVVCAELGTPEQAVPSLHGLAMRVQRSELPSAPELLALATFVDTLWPAVPTVLSEAAQQLAPAGVGVLAFEPWPKTGATEWLPQHLRLVRPESAPSGLSVVHPAGEIDGQGEQRGELALALLKRLL